MLHIGLLFAILRRCLRVKHLTLCFLKCGKSNRNGCKPISVFGLNERMVYTFLSSMCVCIYASRRVYTYSYTHIAE